MASIEIMQRKDSDDFQGVITFGSLNESFISASSHWSLEDYRAHWKQKITQALQGENVCLVTSWSPVSKQDGISGEMWCIYWINDNIVAIQNKLILNSLYISNSGLLNPHSLDPGKRVTVDEDGDYISEWNGTLGDLLSMSFSIYSVEDGGGEEKGISTLF